MVINNEKGQSLLEVVFVIPFLLLFVFLLFKANMAAQMAINNTQFARSQLYVLTANSPEYPRLGFSHFSNNKFGHNRQDRMVLGVADPEALKTAQYGELEPLPQIQKIGRLGSTVQASTESGEGSGAKFLRTDVRVRNTAAICTQLNSTDGKTPMDEKSIPSLGSKRWPFGMSVCQYQGLGG